MKKKILFLSILVVLGLFITGCGNTNENKVLDALNHSVEILKKEYEENGNRGYYVKAIQKKLEDYTIINSSRNEYTGVDGSTEYTMQMVGSSNFSAEKEMTSSSHINYILVYDINSKNYYNIKVEYEQINSHDIPKFVKATNIR